MAKKLPYSIYSQALDLRPVFHGSVSTRQKAKEARLKVRAERLGSRVVTINEEKPSFKVGDSVPSGTVIPGLQRA